jgi:hypothetical protein
VFTVVGGFDLKLVVSTLPADQARRVVVAKGSKRSYGNAR